MRRFFAGSSGKSTSDSLSIRSRSTRATTNSRAKETPAHPPTSIDYPEVNRQIWWYKHNEPSDFHIMDKDLIAFNAYRIWQPLDIDDFQRCMGQGGYMARPHPVSREQYMLVFPGERSQQDDVQINRVHYRQIHQVLRHSGHPARVLESFYDYELIPFGPQDLRFFGPYKPPIVKERGTFRDERSVPLHHTRNPDLPGIFLDQVSNPESYRTAPGGPENVVMKRNWNRRNIEDDYEWNEDRKRRERERQAKKDKKKKGHSRR